MLRHDTLCTTRIRKRVCELDATERAESEKEKKDGREEQEHKKCEIAKYDKDVLESTAGSLAVVTF